MSWGGAERFRSREDVAPWRDIWRDRHSAVYGEDAEDAPVRLAGFRVARKAVSGEGGGLSKQSCLDSARFRKEACSLKGVLRHWLKADKEVPAIDQSPV